MLKAVILGVIIFASFSLVYCAEVGEKITITTYYPSPYGVYNELQTNKMAIGDTNEDGKLSSDDQPQEAGQLQVARSVIFTPQRESPVSGTREGELIYDKLTKSLRYYNGFVWQSAGGACYTHYCYNRGPHGGVYHYVSYGDPVCPVSVAQGTQGPCDNGFTVRKILGAWGYCLINSGASYFLPPGGTCGPAALGYSNGFTYRIGQAYLCCQ